MKKLNKIELTQATKEEFVPIANMNNAKEEAHMKNTDTIVAAETINNTDNVKEEITMKKEITVSIVIDNTAFCKKYNEVDAWLLFEHLCTCGLVASVSDDKGVIKANSAMISKNIKKVYGAPAANKFKGFEEAIKPVSEAFEANPALETEFEETLQQRKDYIAELRKGAKIYAIPTYDVYNGHRDVSTVFGGRLYRKLLSMGEAIDKALLLVKTEIPVANRNTRPEIKQRIDDAHMALHQIAAGGITIRDVKYKFLFQGASGSRKCTSLFIREDLFETMNKWVMNGLHGKDLFFQPNKLNAYLALTSSATTKFIGAAFDIRHTVIISDHHIKINGVCDYVDPKGNVHLDTLREIDLNAFDGMALHRSSLSKEAFTLRHFYVKACTFPCDFDKVSELLGSEIIVDIYGESHNIHDVDLIMAESCFKAKKEYPNWNAYCKECEDRGEEFEICVHEHALRPKDMPYQQGQTLQGGIAEAELFAYKMSDYFDKYNDSNNAMKLLPVYMKEAAKIYKPLMNFWFYKKTLQEVYASRRKKALSGKILGVGYNSFLASDPVAFMQHALGLPVEGIINANCCVCLEAKPGLMDITRNPHLADNAHVILYNKKNVDEAFFFGPTVYSSIHDLAAMRMRADFDGDHVFWSQDRDVLALVNKSAKLLNGRPIDWDAPESQKVRITPEIIAEYIKAGTKRSQIGLYADALTKVFANMAEWIHDDKISVEDARVMIAWLTWAGNVLIDAAKHGGANVYMPNWMSDLVNDSLLPAFCEYAKSDDARPVGSDHWKKNCSKSNSFLDMYSELVKIYVPETLEVKDLGDFVFDASMLLNNPSSRTVPGIALKDLYHPETNTYETIGLFNKLAFRVENERKKLEADETDDDKYDQVHDAHRTIRGFMSFDYLVKVAEKGGYTVEELYDTVTRWLFTANFLREKPTVSKALFEHYFDVFGTMMVETLQRNISTKREYAGFTVEESEG